MVQYDLYALMSDLVEVSKCNYSSKRLSICLGVAEFAVFFTKDAYGFVIMS